MFFRSERPDELRAWYATLSASSSSHTAEGRLLELWQPPPGLYPAG